MLLKLPTRRCLVWPFLFLLAAGCQSQAPPPPPPVGHDQPLRLLVIDDPALAETIRRVWRAKSEAPLEVSERTGGEIASVSRLGADAVIYPSGLLGALAENRSILPLSEEMQSAPEFRQQEVLDMLRLREIRWGEATYAVSFGSPVLLLAYRADVFEQLRLEPPATWDEYQRLAAHLSQRENLGDAAPPEAQPWFGTVEPWGEGWAAQTLLARAAAYARHQDQYSDLFDFSTMEPLIHSPPFVKALEEMTAAVALAPPESMDFAPPDAYREVVTGRAAMALAWPTASAAPQNGAAAPSNRSEVAPGEASSIPPSIEVLWKELPGAKEVYHSGANRWETREPGAQQAIPLLAAAGRLGSVTRETSRAKAAFQVLAVLSSEWSREVAPHSPATTLYRESHLASPADWLPSETDPQTAKSYADAARQSLNRGMWMFSIRIPGRERYLAVLDEAVRQALAGASSPREALQQVAQEWSAITMELGVEQQKNAYERSLGLEP